MLAASVWPAGVVAVREGHTRPPLPSLEWWGRRHCNYFHVAVSIIGVSLSLQKQEAHSVLLVKKLKPKNTLKVKLKICKTLQAHFSTFLDAF